MSASPRFCSPQACSYTARTSPQPFVRIQNTDTYNRSGTAFVNEIPNSGHQFGVINIFATVATTLAVVGAVNSSKNTNIASVFYLLALLILIAELHIVFWVNYRSRLGDRRRVSNLLLFLSPVTQ